MQIQHNIDIILNNFNNYILALSNGEIDPFPSILFDVSILVHQEFVVERESDNIETELLNVFEVICSNVVILEIDPELSCSFLTEEL